MPLIKTNVQKNDSESMQCLSLTLSWILGKNKILGDKLLCLSLLSYSSEFTSLWKYRHFFRRGEEYSGCEACAQPHSPSLLVWLILSLGIPPHLNHDLLWESRGVFFVCFFTFLNLFHKYHLGPCKFPNGTYGRGLKMCFQHITQLRISSVLPPGLSYRGRRHSARLSLLSTNLTATCHGIVQERGPGLVQEGMRSSLLWIEPSLCLWEESGLFWGRSCWTGKLHCLRLLGRCRSCLERKKQSSFSWCAGPELQEPEPPSSRAASVPALWSQSLLFAVWKSLGSLCPMYWDTIV